MGMVKGYINVHDSSGCMFLHPHISCANMPWQIHWSLHLDPVSALCLCVLEFEMISSTRSYYLLCNTFPDVARHQSKRDEHGMFFNSDKEKFLAPFISLPRV